MSNPRVTGTTRVAAVIGAPVRHSRSPAIHNAAFQARGLDWVFTAFEVAAGQGADAVASMRALGLAGLSVTMPHKDDAAWACDELTPDARALAAVNTVVVQPDGRLLGVSTDGDGFLRSLGDVGFDPAERRALVLGAGGAARAIALALGRAGAHVTVAARRREAADAVAGLVLTACQQAESAAIGVDDLSGAELVVNATPVGMRGEAPLIGLDALNACRLVVDSIYHPMETPLLTAARQAGIPTANGLGMLVHQAALAFELWTGVDAPLDVMHAAAASGREEAS